MRPARTPVERQPVTAIRAPATHALLLRCIQQAHREVVALHLKRVALTSEQVDPLPQPLLAIRHAATRSSETSVYV